MFGSEGLGFRAGIREGGRLLRGIIFRWSFMYIGLFAVFSGKGGDWAVVVVIVIVFYLLFSVFF